MQRKTAKQLFASRYHKNNNTTVSWFSKTYPDLYHRVIIPAITDMEYQESIMYRSEHEHRVKLVGVIATDNSCTFDSATVLIKSSLPMKALEELEQREMREYEALKERRRELLSAMIIDRAKQRK